MTPIRHLALLLTLSLLCACGNQAPEQAATAQQSNYIVAVNRPLAFFAEQLLLGGSMDVIMPAPAGTDPAQWRPSVDDILQLQGAELVLLNGAGYSPWLTRISLAANRTVVTSAPSREKWIPLPEQVTHSHGPGGEHAHSGYAFTTWMNLQMAAGQASAVAEALQASLPDQAATIAANAAALLREIETLDQGYAEATAPLRGRQVIYSHPVYQYFEARYQLPGLSLHWEPDAMPTEEQWSELASALEQDALFVWESEPDTEIARRLSSLGVQQLTVDPGANHAGDWLELQRNNVQALQGVR